jgi:hypothetical protein
MTRCSIRNPSKDDNDLVQYTVDSDGLSPGQVVSPKALVSKNGVCMVPQVKSRLYVICLHDITALKRAIDTNK